jgi:hypothetical protein
MTKRSPATMAMASLAAGIGIGVVLVKLVEQHSASSDSAWSSLGKRIADSVAQAIPAQLAQASRLFSENSR